MTLRRLLVPALLVGVTPVLSAHDLFLTLTTWFVPARSSVSIVALNGTFTKSENSIARPRIGDLSLVSPAGRKALDTTAVSAAGTRTVITLHTDAEGTYVAGLSTRASELAEKADAFNKYLAEEGIGPALAERKTLGELGKPVREQYSKHVKTIFQVGKARSDGWNTVLGYPVEIVPLRNPYAQTPADTMRFRILMDGAASPAGQEVLTGGRTIKGVMRPERTLRTDAKGEVTVAPGPAGVWYVKFIRMTRTGKPGIDYISQWATLTFAVAPAPGKTP